MNSSLMVKFSLVVAGLFVTMLALLEIGRQVGIRRRAQDSESASTGFGAIDGAIFGLMGLLLAFAFSGAATRFDWRRQLIVQEANAIGTAYLRIEQLPAAAQPALREDFRSYLDARLALYRNIPIDIEAAKAEAARAVALQGKIWAEAVAACREANFPATTTLVLPSLNEMFDITTTRMVAMQTHPPEIIYWTLIFSVLASSLLAGYGLSGSKSRSWIHILVYAAVLSAAVYIIFDLEHPRVGFIRIDAADQVLIDLRASMK